ncbi:MAG: NAD-dependent epimerase/dehydratase family protein, partial [Bacilli bacterium]
KNLVATLRGLGYQRLLLVDRDTPKQDYRAYVKEAKFIFHFAGVNRPLDPQEFIEGNVDTVSELISWLKADQSKAPIVLSSSIQALADNPYGRSKKAGEDLMIQYGQQTGNQVLLYRFTNIFGKWSRPNYNSVVATFCHNIARNLPIKINDEHAKISLIYVDDVIKEMVGCLQGKVTTVDGILRVLPEYEITVGQLAKLIQSFASSRKNLSLANQQDPLTKKLYATYLSYLDEKEFLYDLTMHEDVRGSFTEMLKTKEEGQVSVNISKPGITKGNHYHHTKNEKFIVVSGEGLIRFRKVDSRNIIEYRVSGHKIQVVDIPPGYAHSIVNIGQTDLVTIMWASEIFDPLNPDTYPMEVEIK